MKIEIIQPIVERKEILKNLLELYQYDFSEFESEDVDENGLFGYKYLDCYWNEPNHYPFLFQVDGKYAGFALVRKITVEDASNPSYMKMCEFFVMRKYRKEGVGKRAAFHIFNLFQDTWEVAELETNLPAQKFWREVISEYTNNNYSEFYRDQWPGPIQRFVTV